MPVTTTLAAALDDARTHTEQLPEHGVMRDGLATGFEVVDRVLCGLRPGQVTVLAGVASVGLTSFAVTVARHVIQAGRRNVVFASVDEDTIEVARNFLSSQSLITADRLRLGTLDDTERTRRDDAIRVLSRGARPAQPRLHGFADEANPLDIVAGRDTTLDDVAAALADMPRVGLLVVDDLKRLVHNDHERHPDWPFHHVDGLVMRRLTSLAAEHGAHVLATVRLYRTRNRSGEPTVSDFWPFDDLHNLADNVLGLWREDLRFEETPERGIMRVQLLRGAGAGHWVGSLAHLLDKRLVANLARGVPTGPVR